MQTVTHTTFKKAILNKGKFEQLIVSPYNSEERTMQKVIVLSDRIDRPSVYTHRRSVLALVLPFSKDIRAALQAYTEDIVSFTGVCAPYFGIRTIEGKELFTIRNEEN